MQRHTITANGLSHHVLDMGEGPAAIFCHGFPAIASSWRGQMEAVAAAGWRALAPDMRGYGGTDKPEAADAYMPFHTIADMVAILDHFGIDQAVIVGHDFGSTIAWNAAAFRPDRFRAVFGMSVAYRAHGGPLFLDRLREAGAHDFYMFHQMAPGAEDRWADAAVTFPGMLYWSSGKAPEGEDWDPFRPARSFLRPAPGPLDWVPEGYVEEAVAAFSAGGFRGPLNYYHAIELFYAIANGAFAGVKVRQPSYFLIGARDGLNQLRRLNFEELTESAPGLRGFSELEGVGHWPQFEAAGTVNRTLVDFLRGLEG